MNPRKVIALFVLSCFINLSAMLQNPPHKINPEALSDLQTSIIAIVEEEEEGAEEKFRGAQLLHGMCTKKLYELRKYNKAMHRANYLHQQSFCRKQKLHSKEKDSTNSLVSAFAKYLSLSRDMIIGTDNSWTNIGKKLAFLVINNTNNISDETIESEIAGLLIAYAAEKK